MSYTFGRLIKNKAAKPASAGTGQAVGLSSPPIPLRRWGEGSRFFSHAECSSQLPLSKGDDSLIEGGIFIFGATARGMRGSPIS